MPRSALMNVMVGAAMKAGRGLARDFGEVANLQVSMKGPGDFVSQADLKAEQTLRRELERVRPGYGFLMEESGTTEGTDPLHRWIVDPLDGTTNFLHSIPIFAVSIALERQDEIVAGVIYNPLMDELFTAERGSGAFLNDRRIRVAQRRELGQSVVTCGIPHQGRGHRGRFVADLTPMMKETAGVRRTGSAALDLAWLAAGRFDGFFERELSYWDFAAGLLIVTEAGGYVTDISGRGSPVKTGHVLAANPELHPQFARALNSAEAPTTA